MNAMVGKVSMLGDLLKCFELYGKDTPIVPIEMNMVNGCITIKQLSETQPNLCDTEIFCNRGRSGCHYIECMCSKEGKCKHKYAKLAREEK